MSTWAEDEVQTADLEDRRLNKRLALLLGQLGEHPQLSIPAACGGWKE
ncbi:MAG: transposase, partial [Methylomonas sp.]|nr:transposase [Methylomonas sp.]